MKKLISEKIMIRALLLIVLLGCFCVLTRINYSDGDDVFFIQNCTSMNLFEYLKWRYVSWTGRMSSEAMMHIVFNLGIWFWRIVNAMMIVALPVAMVKLVNVGKQTSFLLLVLAFSGFILMDVKAFGYSCIWVTGSMNYLWCDVCGIIALLPVAKLYMNQEGMKNAVENTTFFYTIPCAMIAALSSEQMGAVLIAFELLMIAAIAYKYHKIHVMLFVQTILSMIAFLILFLAPGNDLRVAFSVVNYIPQYEMLHLGERIFMTAQWLLSSFANENAILLSCIWIAGIVILSAKKEMLSESGNRNRSYKIFSIMSVIFMIPVFLSKLGFPLFTDMGIDLSEMTGLVEQVPILASLSGRQIFAMIWWSVAMVFTFVLLWRVTNASPVVLLIYLGAIASEATLFFSPTIYSSGERVFFLTDIMLLIILMILSKYFMDEKRSRGYIISCLMIGALHFIIQIPEVLRIV